LEQINISKIKKWTNISTDLWKSVFVKNWEQLIILKMKWLSPTRRRRNQKLNSHLDQSQSRPFQTMVITLTDNIHQFCNNVISLKSKIMVRQLKMLHSDRKENIGNLWVTLEMTLNSWIQQWKKKNNTITIPPRCATTRLKLEIISSTHSTLKNRIMRGQTKD